MIDYPVAPPAGRIRRLEDRDGDGVYERATVFADGLAVSQRRAPLLRRRPGDRCARHLVLPRRRRRRPGRRPQGGADRASARGTPSSGSTACSGGSTTGSTRPTAGATARFARPGATRREGRVDPPPRPAVPVPARHEGRRRSRPSPASASSAWPTTTGATASPPGTRSRSATSSSSRPTSIATRILAETSSIAPILDESGWWPGLFHQSGPGPVQSRVGRLLQRELRPDDLPRRPASARTYRGHAFVCEPLTNLVHRRVARAGRAARSVARRVERGREFLASTDPAFRPVNLTTGPDGALYVVDMYRELVEHPDFVPEDLRGGIEFRRWHDRGRIWRVRSKDAGAQEARRPADPAPGQGEPSASSCTLLDHPVGLVARHGPAPARRAPGSASDSAAEGTSPNRERTPCAGCTPSGRWRDWAPSTPRTSSGPLTMLIPPPRACPSGRRGPTVPWRRPCPLATIIALAADPSIRVRLQAALALGDRRERIRRPFAPWSAWPRATRPTPGCAWRSSAASARPALPFVREWPRRGRTCSTRRRPISSGCFGSRGDRRGQAQGRRARVRFSRLVGPGRKDNRGGARAPDRPSGAARRTGGGHWTAPVLRFMPGWPSLRSMRGPRSRGSTPLWPAARVLALSDQPVDQRRIALEALVRGRPAVAA